MRTLIDIPDPDVVLLNELSKSSSTSRAELVRRAITLYLEPHRDAQTASAFGLWKDFAEDGVEYQRRLRAEWPD